MRHCRQTEASSEERERVEEDQQHRGRGWQKVRDGRMADSTVNGGGEKLKELYVFQFVAWGEEKRARFG